MTEKQNAHINNIVHHATARLINKYVKGQAEHGGNLWEKQGILDMAIDEAIDQVTYLLTLKQQLEDAGITLGTVGEK